MPGRLFLETDTAELAREAAVAMDQAILRVGQNIAPGQEISVFDPAGWHAMRWGLIPTGRRNARGRPVLETLINIRSETAFEKSAFEGLGRAVIPASGWYEWTGERRRKTVWRIAPRAGGVIWFAAMTHFWQAPGGRVVPQCAVLTCAPNPDVAVYHHRMGVILDASQRAAWLGGADPQGILMPPPPGRLRVIRAPDQTI